MRTGSRPAFPSETHPNSKAVTLRRCSAAKFGVEYREPERRRDLRHVVRKEKALERAAARPTFNPGMDLFSEASMLMHLSDTTFCDEANMHLIESNHLHTPRLPHQAC
jgi:hypothetical protein